MRRVAFGVPKGRGNHREGSSQQVRLHRRHRAISSVGRASGFRPDGRWFKSSIAHQKVKNGKTLPAPGSKVAQSRGPRATRAGGGSQGRFRLI